MKKFLACLLSAGMLLSLASCNPKEAVQDAVRDAFGVREAYEVYDAQSSDASVSTAASSAADTAIPDGYDAAYTITIGGTEKWTPFPDATGVTFAHSEESVLDLSGDGTEVMFIGKQVGESVITAALDGVEATALVRVRAKEAGSGWTLRIDEATVLDVMSLASVTYDLDLTATNNSADMFGVYTGELAVEYDADLGGLQAFLDLSGVKMDYETDGWFKNTNFRMELAPYSEEDEARFTDSLKDPTISEEERAQTSAYMNSMFGGIGSGDKDFETSGKPVGLWYDWAFHMTEGDMSAYVNMTSAMFTASASQDANAQNAQGYADHILAGSFHESLSYENESPFPYQIEVYAGGEAVLTLRSPAESPIVVKFYGTLTKN